MIKRYLSAYLLYPLLEKTLKRNILSKFDLLRSYYQLPFSERSRDMPERLYQLVYSASRQIPFYRRHYENYSSVIQKLRNDIRYFQDLPLTNRAHIFNDAVSFFNPNHTRGVGIHRRNTGGSTGASAFVFYDNEALDWTAATNLYAYQLAGKSRHETECHLSSDLQLPATRKDEWRQLVKCWALNRTELKTGAMGIQDLERLYVELRRVKPKLLQGHPSTVYALAEYVRDFHGEQDLFRVFESTGEVLTRKMAVEITKWCGARVYNRYGNAEVGVVAHSIDDVSDLRVMDFTVFPEIVDSQITITGLKNEFMPLIRYQTGDLGDLETRDDGYYLKNITGRIHDRVELGGQTFFTHYIQDFLDHEVGGISEFQLVVNSNSGEKTLKIKAIDSSGCDRIRAKIESKWQQGLKVEFVDDYSSFIRVGREGKFRHLLRI